MNSGYNKSYHKKYRQNIRANGTRAEAFLWNYLKEKKIEGPKFRRQFSVDNLILDFSWEPKP